MVRETEKKKKEEEKNTHKIGDPREVKLYTVLLLQLDADATRMITITFSMVEKCIYTYLYLPASFG